MVSSFLIKIGRCFPVDSAIDSSSISFPHQLSSESTNGTILEPRLNGNLRIEDCSNAASNTIRVALGEIPAVCARTAERIADLRSALDTPSFDRQEDLDDSDWSTMDTFEILYGPLFDEENEVSESADGILEYLENFVSWFGDQIANIDNQDIDIFCNSNWASDTDEYGDDYEALNAETGEDWYFDNSGNNLEWMYLPWTCEDPRPLEGFVGNKLDENLQPIRTSIVSLCDLALGYGAFSTTLASLQANTYGTSAASMESDSLEAIASSTATFLLLHELSHAYALFGSNILVDVKYGWSNCSALAQQQGTNVALSNADTFAFFTAAMYLDQNTWYAGLPYALWNNTYHAAKTASSDAGSDTGSDAGSATSD